MIEIACLSRRGTIKTQALSQWKSDLLGASNREEASSQMWINSWGTGSQADQSAVAGSQARQSAVSVSLWRGWCGSPLELEPPLGGIARSEEGVSIAAAAAAPLSIDCAACEGVSSPSQKRCCYNAKVDPGTRPVVGYYYYYHYLPRHFCAQPLIGSLSLSFLFFFC